MGPAGILWFTQRRKLEKLLVEWAQENNAAQTPINMVAWLMLNDLLDVDAALRLIKGETEHVDQKTD